MTGWMAIGAMMFASAVLGFLVCAFFADNAYERGWRDCLRAYQRERSDW